MNYSKLSYRIASWSFIIVGVGHTITDLSNPKDTSQNPVIKAMEEYTFQIMGTESNILSFHQGYSLMMGLLLFCFGVLSLLILKNTQTNKIPTNILIFNTMTAIVCLALSFKYFFIVPIVLTGLASLGFLLAIVFRKSNDKLG